MGEGKYLLSRPCDREKRVRFRRRLWLTELVIGNLSLGVLWALGYIHPAPAGVMMAMLSGRLGYRLGRYR